MYGFEDWAESINKKHLSCKWFLNLMIYIYLMRGVETTLHTIVHTTKFVHPWIWSWAH